MRRGRDGELLTTASIFPSLATATAPLTRSAPGAVRAMYSTDGGRALAAATATDRMFADVGVTWEGPGIEPARFKELEAENNYKAAKEVLDEANQAFVSLNGKDAPMCQLMMLNPASSPAIIAAADDYLRVLPPSRLATYGDPRDRSAMVRAVIARHAQAVPELLKPEALRAQFPSRYHHYRVNHRLGPYNYGAIRPLHALATRPDSELLPLVSQWLETVGAGSAEAAEARQLATSAMAAIARNIHATALSNGTAVGQVHRLLTAIDIYARTAALNRTPSTEYAEAAAARCPLRPAAIAEAMGTDRTYRDILLGPGVFRLFKLTAKSDSGPSRNTGRAGADAKKGATFVGDVAWMRSLLATADVDPAIAYRAILNSAVTLAKPKYEAREAADVNKSWRTIYVPNSYLQVATGPLVAIISASMPDAVFQDGVMNNSLYGWNQTQGIAALLADFCIAAMQSPRGLYLCGYSDNLYAARYRRGEGLEIASLDGNKYESSSTPPAGFAVTDWAARAGLDFGGPAVHNVVGQVAAVGSHNCAAVWDDIAFRLPGLASGANTTFVTNHVRMMHITDRAYREANLLDAVEATVLFGGDPMASVEEALRRAFLPLVDFKVAATTADPRFRSTGGRSPSLRYVTLSELIASDGASTLLCRLDLLGYDACALPFGDQVLLVPVLNYGKLAAAMAVNKSAELRFALLERAGIGAIGAVVTELIKVLTVHAFWNAGAMVYPDLATWCIAAVRAAEETLAQRVEGANLERLMQTIESDPEIRQILVAVFSGSDDPASADPDDPSAASAVAVVRKYLSSSGTAHQALPAPDRVLRGLGAIALRPVGVRPVSAAAAVDNLVDQRVAARRVSIAVDSEL